MTGIMGGSTLLLDWLRQRVTAIVNENPVDYEELGVFVIVIDTFSKTDEMTLIAGDVDTSSVDVLVDTYYALGEQVQVSLEEGEQLLVERPGIIGQFARYE